MNIRDVIVFTLPLTSRRENVVTSWKSHVVTSRALIELAINGFNGFETWSWIANAPVLRIFEFTRSSTDDYRLMMIQPALMLELISTSVRANTPSCKKTSSNLYQNSYPPCVRCRLSTHYPMCFDCSSYRFLTEPRK